MPKEEIEYQYIMNYKAHRRIMLAVRITVTLLISGGLAALCALAIPLGVIASVAVLFFGAIWVIIGLHKERTYTIYNTRFVIKFKEKCKSVPLENIISVRFRSAFYERDLLTGTLTITAKNEKGRVRRYRMEHIFNAADGVKYLEERIRENSERAVGN